MIIGLISIYDNDQLVTIAAAHKTVHACKVPLAVFDDLLAKWMSSYPKHCLDLDLGRKHALASAPVIQAFDDRSFD